MSYSVRTRRSFISVIATLTLLSAANNTNIIAANSSRYPVADNTPAKITASVPRGFEDTLVIGVPSPTDLAFTPDGRMLVTSQPGQLYVIPQNYKAAAAPPPALNLAKVVCNNIETGLDGLTIDPNFGNNGYIYVYYTYREGNDECPYVSPTFNRVSRFTLEPGNTIDAQSELILLDHLPTPRGSHNGSGLRFGQDGKLYVSVGDGSTLAGYAGSLAMLNGKILRINADGTSPSDNPYFNLPNAQPCANIDTNIIIEERVCQEVWAKGLRNPFRFTFGRGDDGNEIMYINDVGWRTWEEINIGKAGADYGWPTREGLCETDTFGNDCDSASDITQTDPIFSYHHENSDHCSAVTGGAIVPRGIWPEIYDDSYLFGDFACGSLFQIKKSGNTYVKSTVATELAPIISMMFAPYNNTQALYYTTYGPYDSLFGSVAGGAGVRRMVYLGDTNAPPTASAIAQPNYSAAAPASITFNALRSRDPNGTPLRYEWQFGDDSAIITATTPIIQHSYAKEGLYTALLTVYDNLNTASQPAHINVYIGNTPPKASIIAPSADSTFKVGQAIILRAEASDDDDGILPDSSFIWEAFLHHVDISDSSFVHEHPLLAPVKGKNIIFTAPKQEDIFAGHSRVEVRLTATDSQGLTTIVTRTLQPALVQVTITSDPPGLKIRANNADIKTPAQLTVWDGYPITLSAPTTQKGATSKLAFSRWGSGATREHSVVATGTSMTIHAIYACAPGDCNIYIPSLFRTAIIYDSPIPEE